MQRPQVRQKELRWLGQGRTVRWSPGLWDSKSRGFHVLTFLSLSSPLCKDSRTSRPSLDSWGNRSSHPVVCSRVWLGTKNFCLRTLWACSPQPLETHWKPFAILLPKNPAPLLPTARPQPHAAMLPLHWQPSHPAVQSTQGPQLWGRLTPVPGP